MAGKSYTRPRYTQPRGYLLLLPLASPRLTETLGKWIVVDL